MDQRDTHHPGGARIYRKCIRKIYGRCRSLENGRKFWAECSNQLRIGSHWNRGGIAFYIPANRCFGHAFACSLPRRSDCYAPGAWGVGTYSLHYSGSTLVGCTLPFSGVGDSIVQREALRIPCLSLQAKKEFPMKSRGHLPIKNQLYGGSLTQIRPHLNVALVAP